MYFQWEPQVGRIGYFGDSRVKGRGSLKPNCEVSRTQKHTAQGSKWQVPGVTGAYALAGNAAAHAAPRRKNSAGTPRYTPTCIYSFCVYFFCFPCIMVLLEGRSELLQRRQNLELYAANQTHPRASPPSPEQTVTTTWHYQEK